MIVSNASTVGAGSANPYVRGDAYEYIWGHDGTAWIWYFFDRYARIDYFDDQQKIDPPY